MKFTRFILLRKMNFDDEERYSTANPQEKEFFQLFKDVIINQPNIDLSFCFLLGFIVILFKPSDDDIERFFTLNFYFYVKIILSVIIYYIFLEFFERIKFQTNNLWHTIKSAIRLFKIILYSITYFTGMIFALTFSAQEAYINKQNMNKFHLVSLQFYAFYSLFRVGYFFIKVFCNVLLCNVYFSSIILSILEDEFNKKLNQFVDTHPYSTKQSDLQDSEYCSICLGVFSTQDLVSVLPCSRRHSFHTICLEKWFRSTLTCPLCRSDFNNSRMNNINNYQELNDIRENLI